MKYVLCVYEHVWVGVVWVVLRVGFPRALCGSWKSTIHVQSHVGKVKIYISVYFSGTHF